MGLLDAYWRIIRDRNRIEILPTWLSGILQVTINPIVMLGRELQSRANRLVKDSKERADKAKRQAEKERILRQRQEERQRQFEEQKRQQRLAEEAATEAVRIGCTIFVTTVWVTTTHNSCRSLAQALQERLRHEEDLEKNNGVWWQERLVAVPLQAGVVEQLGIKRSTDKVIN